MNVRTRRCRRERVSVSSVFECECERCVELEEKEEREEREERTAV